ncbi:zf-HC2 domain-containing protein [Amycolatopsis sp. 195334CR]|nr:zf-HC2 domain-containing protein [Amycolatopsis sp. 195334CR]
MREALGAYLSGQLTDPEREQIDAHLAGCAPCRDELTALSTVAQRLSTADPDQFGAPAPAPPPELADAVLARVRAERRRRAPVWALPVTSAAAAAVLGIALGWQLHPDPPAVPLENVTVQATGQPIQAAAQLVPHTWGVEIKLTGSGFEPGRTYRVMITGPGDQRVPAGEFIGTGPAEMRCNLNSSILRTNATGFQVIDADDQVVLTSRF